MDFDKAIGNYGGDQLFESIWRSYNGKDGNGGTKKKVLIVKVLASFQRDGARLWYVTNVCVPRCARYKFLHMTHDLYIGGHFPFYRRTPKFREI